jgi:hypothetical protein
MSGVYGSCVLALPVGAPRDSPVDGVRVGPVGDRLAEILPVRGSADLAAGVARPRPLVFGLLRQFGLVESRHIDTAGVLRRRHFTGFDGRIRAWSEAIGVPSR